MSDLPRISVVVPNLNSAATLERCLRSVIDQRYPALELIVVDGGSSDGSVEVIQKYADRIAWWVSEKDRGQASGINKGFARATGDVMNWLCSDDELLPGALARIGRAFAERTDADVVSGACRVVFDDGAKPDRLWLPRCEDIELMPCGNPVAQQATYWRRAAVGRAAVLDESFHVAMDTELFNWLRGRGARWACIDAELAVFHMTGTNKTSRAGAAVTVELERIFRAYAPPGLRGLAWWQRRVRYPIERRLARTPRGRRRQWWRRVLRLVDLPLGLRFGRRHVAALSWRHWV